MTIFSEEPHSRQMERLMTAIPNFKPRGIGVRFSESQVLITITAATPTQILTAAMRQIRCPPFLKRFSEYIESEESIMTFSNEKHMAMFALAVKNAERENYALLSAIYLLTVENNVFVNMKDTLIFAQSAQKLILKDNCITEGTEFAYEPVRTMDCGAVIRE